MAIAGMETKRAILMPNFSSCRLSWLRQSSIAVQPIFFSEVLVIPFLVVKSRGINAVSQ